MSTIDLLSPEYQKEVHDQALAAEAAITAAKVAVDKRIAELEEDQEFDYLGIVKTVLAALKLIPMPDDDKVVLHNAVDLVNSAMDKHWK